MTTLSNSYRKQKSKEEKKKGQQHLPVQISESHCFADTRCHGRQCLLGVNIPTFPLPPELGYTVVSSPVSPQAVSNAEGNVELQESAAPPQAAQGTRSPRCSGRGSYVRASCRAHLRHGYPKQRRRWCYSHSTLLYRRGKISFWSLHEEKATPSQTNDFHTPHDHPSACKPPSKIFAPRAATRP